MITNSAVFCSTAKRALPAALCSLFLLGSAAHAAEGFYVLGSVGSAQFDPDTTKSRKDAIVTEAVGLDLKPDHSSQDDTDTGYKLQVGYQFNDNFAIEGGYVDFGELVYKATYDDFGSGKEKLTAKGWNIDALLTLPINAGVSLFAKVGAIHAEVKEKYSFGELLDGGDYSEKESNVKAKFGAGVAYNFYQGLSARLEAEYYNKLGDDDKTGEVDIALYSLGLSYHF